MPTFPAVLRFSRRYEGMKGLSISFELRYIPINVVLSVFINPVNMLENDRGFTLDIFRVVFFNGQSGVFVP